MHPLQDHGVLAVEIQGNITLIPVDYNCRIKNRHGRVGQGVR